MDEVHTSIEVETKKGTLAMELLTKENLTKAAIVGVSVMVALRFAGGKSKLIQGAAAVGAAAVGNALAAKVA